ncbi:peptide-methionine (S)-S-oxide reductase MsrA [Daejeonella lutea]|uniref:Peptide methionine sulfoxide reductase MsrA n=1 Tax=Daejeonella lutea TaxID=572036 RepID=A0A1T5AIJ6_9SPHI|nr:peptide-methionine (S)-S-oxide reductase MsrA [Daejeonella lutea]SKB34828.1 peptide-methionine (S)-S-oxide reductase [Daejeonella lutea]
MKKLIFYLSVMGLFIAWTYDQIGGGSFTSFPAPAKGEDVATFAGGCFWAMEEAMSELNGVNQVVSGYAGGTVKNPTYEQVCSRTTGHAESVQIYYNPKVISYATLVEAFFYAHDPTTLNRQGPDVGDDYRSAVFYRTPTERQIVEDIIRKVTISGHYKNAIVTQIEPFKEIYPAEKYHQDYFKNHPDKPYIRKVSLPKVMKMRKEMSGRLKPEFRI